MPITSSQIISKSTQRNGILVTERHEASSGEVFTINYLLVPNATAEDTLSARTAALDIMLIEDEAGRLLDAD